MLTGIRRVIEELFPKCMALESVVERYPRAESSKHTCETRRILHSPRLAVASPTLLQRRARRGPAAVQSLLDSRSCQYEDGTLELTAPFTEGMNARICEFVNAFEPM